MPSVADEPEALRALRKIKGNTCKAIIAMSECAARIQRAFLRQFPRLAETIEAKLHVLHPPQPLGIESIQKKAFSEEGPVRFMFVGASFHRKGGAEVLETLAEMRRDYAYPVLLTVVSSLCLDNYATNETPRDIAEAERLLVANAGWVQHFRSLPNAEIVKLMRQHDVGLLPTYADTYGYSVLEFQSCGCPVITTDVRALPEINDERCGWVIKAPKNPLGEALYGTPSERERISEAIRRGMRAAIGQIFADRAILRVKGEAALMRIRDEHSPTKFAARLQAIYQAGLTAGV